MSHTFNCTYVLQWREDILSTSGLQPAVSCLWTVLMCIHLIWCRTFICSITSFTPFQHPSSVAVQYVHSTFHAVSFFYYPQHCTPYSVSWQMQCFYATKLQCLGKGIKERLCLLLSLWRHFVDMVWSMVPHYDRLLPLSRQFLLIPNSNDKFINRTAKCATPCFNQFCWYLINTRWFVTF